MKNISSITTANMKNNFRSKTVIIIWYGTTLLILAALAALFIILLIAPELKKVSPDMAKLELYLGIILFSASALGLGINLSALGFTSMIREKSRGNIQSLLATPVRLKDIWIGKSLAIFIPGLILGERLTLTQWAGVVAILVGVLWVTIQGANIPSSWLASAFGWLAQATSGMIV